jgi:N-carbamoyl-L-amino-acid hydrolase
MDAAVSAAAERIGSDRRVAVEIDRFWRKDPIAFDSGIASAIAKAADDLGLKKRTITSGAHHDAVLAASVVPSAMIFVPCKDGISHNEAESATKEDCAAGADVLLRTVLALAG